MKYCDRHRINALNYECLSLLEEQKAHQLVVVLGAGDAEKPGKFFAPGLAVAEKRRASDPSVVDHPRDPETSERLM